MSVLIIDSYISRLLFMPKYHQGIASKIKTQLSILSRFPLRFMWSDAISWSETTEQGEL